MTNSWWKKWQPKFMYTFSISFISTLVQFLRLLQWKVDISLQETCISTSRTWVQLYAGWDSACNGKCVCRRRISYNAYCSQKNNIKYSFGLSKNCRFSYIILESLKSTSKQMYLFPNSVENNKESDRNKCDPRETIAVGFWNGLKQVKLLPVEATGTWKLYTKT